MKAISVLLIFAAAAATTFAQTRVIAQGNVSVLVPGTNRNNYTFNWQSRLDPAAPPLANPLGFSDGFNSATNCIYRVMIDRASRFYFGYEVRVEPLPQIMFRVTFQPLNLTPEIFEQIHIDPANWNKLDVGRPVRPLGQSPDTVAELDVVEVDLMTNPSNKQKMVDYFTLQGPASTPLPGLRSFDLFTPAQRDFSYPPGEPRDFAVQDATLRFVQPRFVFNGKPEGATSDVTLTDSIVWLYVRGHGRYIMTLSPHPEAGFHKAGEVRGSSLEFTLGSDRVLIASARPIVNVDAAFNLYVLQDPSYGTTPTGTSSRIGGTTSELLSFLDRIGFRRP